ncbi:MAG: nuclear transport factor 2 family protein [Cyanobacteria bacterium P01_D01_bin.73]
MTTQLLSRSTKASSDAQETLTLDNWLAEFEDCVRSRDTDRGRQLFDENVYAFGTRADVATGLDDLVKNQWTPIWLNTQGFHFLFESAKYIVSDDRSTVCAMVSWESHAVENGQKGYLRSGRCTLALRKDSSAPFGYLAMHSHFSKLPKAEF